MARIKTYYDYEIKKEAFEVLGDVGYTKSTDITLTPIAFSNTMIEHGVQTFTVEVVGEKGTSEIIIFDNDLPIPVTIDGTETDMIVWNYENDIVTFTVNLNYDVEHNIRARFKGNDKCLGSKSRLITINEPTPDAYSSTLQRYNDSTVNYTPNTSFTVPIEFVSGQTLINPETKPVEWFINDVSQGTVDITVPSNSDRGNTNLSVSGLSAGAYTIRLEFEGDTHSGKTSASFQISVGHILTVTSAPTFIINSQNLTVSARVENYLGTPLSGVGVYVMERYGDWQYEGTTNSNGECTITCNSGEWSIVTSTFDLEYIVFTSQVELPRYSTQVIRNVTVNLTADTLITTQNRQSTITATINGTRNSIPITFTGGITGTYASSEDGLVVRQYQGTSAGDVSVTASITGSSSTLTIEDVLQYWRASNVSYNQSYTVQSGTLQELSNGYKLVNGGAVKVNQNILENFELTFNIIQANSVYKETSSTGQGTTTKNVTYTNAEIKLFISGGITVTVKTGDTVKFVHNNGKYTAYLNNSVIFDLAVEFPEDIGFLINTITSASAPGKQFISSFITFNNLKIKRV